MRAGHITLDLPDSSQCTGLHFCTDPQGRDSANCPFCHITISNTMLAAHVQISTVPLA